MRYRLLAMCLIFILAEATPAVGDINRATELISLKIRSVALTDGTLERLTSGASPDCVYVLTSEGSVLEMSLDMSATRKHRVLHSLPMGSIDPILVTHHFTAVAEDENRTILFRSNERRSVFRTGASFANSLIYSSKHKRLFIAGAGYDLETKKSLVSFDFSTESETVLLTGESIGAIVLAKDESRLYAMGLRGLYCFGIYEAKTAEIGQYDFEKHVFSMDSNGSVVIVGNDNQVPVGEDFAPCIQLEVRSFGDSSPISRHTIFGVSGSQLCISPNGRYTAIRCNQKMIIYDIILRSVIGGVNTSYHYSEWIGNYLVLGSIGAKDVLVVDTSNVCD